MNVDKLTKDWIIFRRGSLTSEYFHPFAHDLDASVYQAPDARERRVGRAV
jgi:hypothetical protein